MGLAVIALRRRDGVCDGTALVFGDTMGTQHLPGEGIDLVESQSEQGSHAAQYSHVNPTSGARRT
jgi:hypothetical protein